MAEQTARASVARRIPHRWWGVLIGAGLALSAIHNQQLTNLTTNQAGETLFFLPAFGYLVLIMGTGLFLLNHWDKVRAVGWGDRRVAGCLLFIALAMALSGIGYTGWQAKIAPLGMGLTLFATYLTARVIGRDLFLPLAIGAIVASVGVIAHQAVYPGVYTGGFVFERNYDILTGYVLLGIVLYRHRHQWALVGLGVTALFLSGSPEAVLPIGVLGLAVLIRKDWSKRLLAVIAPIIVAASILLVTGVGQSLYGYTAGIFRGEHTVSVTESDGTVTSTDPLTWRYTVLERAMTNIRPLGDGYSATNFTLDTAHNVPLILVQQMGFPGILAAIAWLWVSVWCLVKTRWKYAWLAILSLSVFDHFIWTQLAPVWWMVVGASTASSEPDLIFRMLQGGSKCES